MATRRGARRVPGANESQEEAVGGDNPPQLPQSPPVNPQGVIPGGGGLRRSPVVGRSPPPNYDNVMRGNPMVQQPNADANAAMMQAFMQAMQQNNDAMLRQMRAQQEQAQEMHQALMREIGRGAAQPIPMPPPPPVNAPAQGRRRDALGSPVRGRNPLIPGNPPQGNVQGNPRTQHLKTTDAKIPTYCGSTDAKTPYDYIIEMEKYKEIIGYTEAEMIQYVIPLSLVGDAFNWYRYEPPFLNWDEFKRRLREEFQAFGYYEDLKWDLHTRTQGPTESLGEFIRVIRGFYERLGGQPQEREIVERILRNMHPEYRQALQGKTIRTLVELKTEAHNAQELIKNYRTYRPPPTLGSLEPSLAWRPVLPPHSMPSRVEETAHMTMESSRSGTKLHIASVDPFAYHHSLLKKRVNFETEAKQTNSRSPVPRTNSPTGARPSFRSTPPANSREGSPARNCYSCGELGHFARDCTKGSPRNSPRKFGERSSPKSSSATGTCGAVDENNANVGRQKTIRPPFMQVKILENSFSAFLDTGSSVSIIGDEVFQLVQQAGVKCRKLEKSIRFLKGAYKAERCVTLKVLFGEDRVKKQTFLIVPGSIKTLLLGRDFLGPAMISVHIGQGGWSVGETIGTVIPFTEPPTQFLPSNSDLPTENIIPLETESDYDSCDEEVNQYMEKAVILVNWDACPESATEPQEYVENVPTTQLLALGEGFSLVVPDWMSFEEKYQLQSVVQPFSDLFTKKPGLCKLYEHKIDTGEHKAITGRLRPMNPAVRAAFDRTFYELVKYDVIEPSTSPWSSSAFIVPKPDGTSRFVVDYKPLNAITVPDQYPMSRMDDMLAILGTCKYFSTFDLAKGFYQIQMHESDKEKTAFLSHHELWQFKRLPMGLRNSPATFVRCVDQVMGNLKWQICCVYFDDIIIFSQTFEEHLSHIKEVLNRLQEAGLTIHPAKVQLCRRKLKFLGHIIEPGKCAPNPDKVLVLRSYPTPKNGKDIQRFLGLVGFYRRFVPDFAVYAKPLQTLIKKGVKFSWSEECERSFQFLKNSLSDTSEVFIPDLNKPFIIQCDASDVTIGSVLIQEVDGERFPVWFASRCLKPSEQKYSVSEKECLAVLWAINKFRGYVECSHFIVETDHQALSWLRRIKEPAGRLARWFMTLQMYDFEVHYKPGQSKLMAGADALSRIPREESNLADFEYCFLSLDEGAPVITRQQVILEQRNDPILKCIVSYMQNNKDSDSKKDNSGGELTAVQLERIKALSQKCVILDDGMLMRYVGPRGQPWDDESYYWRIYLPSSLKFEVMHIFHSDVLAGHLGVRKTFNRLESRVYWRNIRRDVADFVKRCIECQMTKKHKIPLAPASTFEVESPWDLWTIDLMGPYPKGSKQNTYLFVVVDYFTKYVEMFPLRIAKAETITEKLWSVCCRWGLPRVILSDNGTQFTSKHYSDWCNAINIKPFYISAYHPQANATERYNQTIKSMIVATIDKCKQWDIYIPEIAFALRTAVNDSTGFTPAMMNTGREFRTPFDNLVDVNLPTITDKSDLLNRITMVHIIARDNLIYAKSNYLGNYNKTARLRKIEVGDKVLLKSHFLSDGASGFSSKLAPKREGPYLVTNKVSSKSFDLKCLASGQVVNKAHINELTPYYDPIDHESQLIISSQEWKAPCSVPPEEKLLPSSLSQERLYSYDGSSRAPNVVSALPPTHACSSFTKTSEGSIREILGEGEETDSETQEW